MTIKITRQPEPDGTLKFLVPDHDVLVFVGAQRRQGPRHCPVELWYQADKLVAIDANLRLLRDLTTLAQLAKTLADTPPWLDILSAIGKDLPAHVEGVWDPVVTTLADYTIVPKEYLWYPVIPKAEPVAIGGDPGVGKSVTVVRLISHLTTGTAFPTLFDDRPEAPFDPQHVVLYTYEDDIASTVSPRVVINGGDTKYVHIVQGKRAPGTTDVFPMSLQDLPTLRKMLDTYQPALLVFDPLQSFWGPNVDQNRASDTRPILDAVNTLCKAHGCTVLYVRHHGKSQHAKAQHAGLGSTDITASLRSELALYKDDQDPALRILAQVKSNGRDAPSIQLRLSRGTCPVVVDGQRALAEEVRASWDGKSPLTADDLNARDTAHGGDTDEATSALDGAREFLREVLAAAPVLVEDLLAQAKKAGVSEKTVRRAKDKEHVKARRRPQDGMPGNKWPWEWYLPTRNGGTA
jgi:hypothetical protein